MSFSGPKQPLHKESPPRIDAESAGMHGETPVVREYLMESLKEFTNVVFDDVRVGATAELTVALKQSQIDVAAMVSGDVDALYLKGKDGGDSRSDPARAKAAGAEALVSLILGTRLPGPGTKILHRNLRFAGDFAVGDILTAKVTALEKQEDGHQIVFDCSCINQSGLQLVSGTVRVEAPTTRLTYENFRPPQIELRWGDPIAKLIQSCRGFDPIPCAVVHPCSEDSLAGAVEAARELLHRVDHDVVARAEVAAHGGAVAAGDAGGDADAIHDA